MGWPRAAVGDASERACGCGETQSRNVLIGSVAEASPEPVALA